MLLSVIFLFFFFNDTATTEIYTLSLHDALPISRRGTDRTHPGGQRLPSQGGRSEEHTSELQSRRDLVCRLLLEKKNILNVASYFFKILFYFLLNIYIKKLICIIY